MLHRFCITLALAGGLWGGAALSCAAASLCPWHMQIFFRDGTRTEITIPHGTELSFSGETLITGTSSMEVSEIDRITFATHSDAVDAVEVPEFSITVLRESIEISGRPQWLTDVSVFDLNGAPADVAVSKPEPGKAVVDCTPLAAGFWILRVKDKSLIFHKK